MVLGSGGRPADDQHIRDFVSFAQERNIDLNDLWIAENSGAILWAMLPVLSPGRTMLLLTPGDAPQANARDATAMLLDSVCDAYAGRDVQLAQALLEAGDGSIVRLFESKRFERMAELIYLNADVRRPLPAPALPEGFTLSTYSPSTHSLFAAAIIASYQNSLDCPGLNGVRDIEDVILGHKASGEFDPRHWFVLCQRDAAGAEQPSGVLLLSKLPRGDSVELVYLGISPDVRGKGLGNWLMRRAFTSAAGMGAARVSLAVDSLNAPALRLYHRAGFSRLGSKVAMMRHLR